MTDDNSREKPEFAGKLAICRSGRPPTFFVVPMVCLLISRRAGALQMPAPEVVPVEQPQK